MLTMLEKLVGRKGDWRVNFRRHGTKRVLWTPVWAPDEKSAAEWLIAYTKQFGRIEIVSVVKR